MSDHNESQVEQDRVMILNAQERGLGSTLGAYSKLSGPGWLQSAITLGGGSLSGALFLGILTERLERATRSKILIKSLF